MTAGWGRMVYGGRAAYISLAYADYAAPYRCTVSYRSEKGTGCPADAARFSFEAGTVSETAPARAGYAFAGWQDEEGRLYAAGDALPARDAVLTAVWRALPVPQEPAPGGTSPEGNAPGEETPETSGEETQGSGTPGGERPGDGVPEEGASGGCVPGEGTSAGADEEPARAPGLAEADESPRTGSENRDPNDAPDAAHIRAPRAERAAGIVSGAGALLLGACWLLRRLWGSV